MFEPFSSGYYLGRLYVEPHDGDRTLMQESEHEHVNRQLYAIDEGVERVDNPLVMKVDTTHLAVRGDPAIPDRTLAVPEDVLAGTRVRNPPALKEVLLAKADRAAQFLPATP